MTRYVYLLLMLIVTDQLIYSQKVIPVIQWYNIYDGPGGAVDVPNDFASDRMNNIYLAGRSAGTDATQDLLILKYTTSGELAAEIRFSPAVASWDEAYSIDLDSDLNIWVSGISSFGTSSPYALLHKYSPSGELLFAKNYTDDMSIHSDGGKVVIDSHNNVIHAYSRNNAIIGKYSASGDSLWSVLVYDDTSTYNLGCLLRDKDDNIFAAFIKSFWDGSDLPSSKAVIVKITSAGELLWKKEYACRYATKMILDRENNLLLISGGDGQLLKIDVNGNLLWTDDNSSMQQPMVIITGVAADSENNVIISGYGGMDNTWDYVVEKLSPAGNELWVKTFNGEINLNDFAIALSLDKENNIYITGATHNSISTGICYTVKYSPAGEVKWVNSWDDPHSIFENGGSLFVDDSSEVYVAGEVADSTTGLNFFAMKIKQTGSTDVNEEAKALPGEFALSPNYPNPFNPETSIKYSVPAESFVEIKIYDILGNEVQTLISEQKTAGNYEVRFNGNNIASGTYICRMKAGNYSGIIKMLLLK